MSSKNVNHSFFTITKETKEGRTGVINTPHGSIETPAFIPVGTQATVKSLSPCDLIDTGVQIYFVNTYHMMLRPGIEVIKKSGGLHSFMNWNKPLITDSGGFQVFSLGRLKKLRGTDIKTPALQKIDDKGVTFRSHWDGQKHRLTPKKSIGIQHDLGADLIVAFDDCATYPITKKKARVSLSRTHKWAKESLAEHTKLTHKYKKGIYIYGAVQGSVYKDLREESALFIASCGFDGFAIGGVSVGETKREMESVLKWIVPILPKDKPRHLLGVGEIDDIFTLVRNGIDTFDCVLPTRLARMGYLLTTNKSAQKSGKKCVSDITKSIFKNDIRRFDDTCSCYLCTQFTRAYINHLFKVKELLAYRLATIHNIHFMESLMKKIRESLPGNELHAIEKEYL